ncbi:hypothetical protein SCA6_016310 [Theobroma cacao]
MPWATSTGHKSSIQANQLAPSTFSREQSCMELLVAQVITGGDAGIGRSVCYHSALEAATLAFTYVKGQENRDKDDTLQMLQEEKTCEAKDALAIAAHIRTVGGHALEHMKKEAAL